MSKPSKIDMDTLRIWMPCGPENNFKPHYPISPWIVANGAGLGGMDDQQVLVDTLAAAYNRIEELETQLKRRIEVTR